MPGPPKRSDAPDAEGAILAACGEVLSVAQRSSRIDTPEVEVCNDFWLCLPAAWKPMRAGQPRPRREA